MSDTRTAATGSDPGGNDAPLPAHVLERRYLRSLKKVAALEGMIEDKTRSLYLAQTAAEKQSEFLSRIIDRMNGLVLTTGADGLVDSVAGSTAAALGGDANKMIGRPLSSVLVADELRNSELGDLAEEAFEAELHRADDANIPVIAVVSRLSTTNSRPGYVCLATDISRRKQLELELRQAHKLESVGQLAAGVAHEINTPVQFIGDNVLFLGEALADLLELANHGRKLREAAATHPELTDLIAAVAKAESEADLEFLEVEGPAAVQRTNDGVERVGTIVKAMKQFSHPGSESKAPENLNEMIRSTLVVATNEHKYVADVVTDLGELPPVNCLRGDISQVILNIVVNAAHAIGDRVKGTANRGLITVTTSAGDEAVTITIADTGGGVPDEIRERVFDPFFTTKEVGRGTGQGLAISRTIVVDKHQGRLTLEVEEGVGSTFRIWLPLVGE